MSDKIPGPYRRLKQSHPDFIEAYATAGEIRRALMLLVSTVGFSTMFAALTRVEDIIAQSG